MAPSAKARSAAPRTARAAASPHARRLARLKQAFSNTGIDALLVSNPLDVGYLTGFLGGDSYLIVGPPKPVLISDGRYDEELRPFHHLVDVVIRDKAMPAAVGDAASALGVSTLGLQGEHVTLAERDILGKAMSGKKLIATSHLVGEMRVIKDDAEIELIRAAIKLQEKALKALLPTIKPGQTELQLAANLEGLMKTFGASAPGFQSIIAVGANGALPHYRPAKVKVVKSKPLLIDWGAIYQGYQGDMTRTFSFGKWHPKMKEIYQVVLEAQLAAADALKPGASTHAVHQVARDIIDAAGYGAYFNHGTGHGLGMSKEPPFLNVLYPDIPLKPGHVVTVEPGIYLPGLGGVRIEDQYVVTQTGAKNLCSLPKSLAWSTL